MAVVDEALVPVPVAVPVAVALALAIPFEVLEIGRNTLVGIASSAEEVSRSSLPPKVSSGLSVGELSLSVAVGEAPVSSLLLSSPLLPPPPM